MTYDLDFENLREIAEAAMPTTLDDWFEVPECPDLVHLPLAVANHIVHFDPTTVLRLVGIAERAMSEQPKAFMGAELYGCRHGGCAICGEAHPWRRGGPIVPNEPVVFNPEKP